MEAQALHGNVERKREGGQEELERQQQSQQRLKSRIDDLIGSAQASDAEIEAASDALLNELRSSAGSGRQKAVDPLLAALRLPNLSDRVQETIAAAISLCSGAHTNHASSSYRTFTFSPSLRVNIHEIDFADGGVGWKVWGGALLLSLRLIEIPSLVKNKRVLELGSGCGLCGLLASKLGASEVVLTDYLPSLLLNLRRNVSLFRNQRKEIQRQFSYSSRSVSYDNHITCVMAEDSVGPRVDTSQDDYLFPGETSTSTRTIRLRTLDWLESPGTQEPPLSFANLDLQLPPRISTEQVFDVVMGSDVIYEERLIQPLVATMSRHLAKPHGKGLIVAPIREKRLLEVFLKEVEHYKMRATVVQVEASEWSRCKAIVNGETESSYDDDDDEFLEDEQGTMQDIDYYDAGYVSITVTHKLTAEPLDIEH
ncbi:hypothetical protein MPTK1_1g12550 [Marchantia polymorpha subsp. ruderalis]|uniref:FAM86 N-terminal domain-containing protein n=2 Tax=Marchantia polymorpha TaxID=3197 RepID=A0AAF6APE7_MARPO|nr:hypothetical protein MARPO_0019s0025 [Marchantia polymorpha]BBM98317.1 hypothetical protein Mp_1g12550 [Marchantia polymorpha subsp. ruderalis]|eukprot:PTQ44584.1 hypothetical protein MARPO_0019s0025 [Marchantia polymorpha]